MLYTNPETKETKVLRIPHTIRYVDTGKVRIGSAYIAPPKRMTYDEEVMQRLLMGEPIPHRFSWTVYTLYVIGVLCLLAALLQFLR
jgi:hypothetical protein